MTQERSHSPISLCLGLAALMAMASVCGCKEIATEGISFLSWSPDGRVLGSIYGGVIYLGAPDGTVPLKSFESLELAENHLSWSPDGGALVYTSAKAGSWDIWVLDIRQGKSIPIAQHPAKDQRPYWHPSGKRILFLSYRSLRPDLWEFDIVSKETRQLTSDDLEENHLTFSKDGGQVAFLATDAEGASDLVVIDHATHERTRLLARLPDLQEAAISPDGKQVCFVRGKELRLLDIRLTFGAQNERLLVPATDKAISDCGWSPDGKSILFLRDGRAQIRSIELFGGVRPLAPSIGRDSFPRWSPRDDTVAYASSGESGRPLLALVNPKTAKREWLVQTMADSVEAARYVSAANCWDEAARVLESALTSFPADQSSADAIELITEAYFRLGRYEKLLSIHKRLTLDHVAIGLIYLFCYQDVGLAREEFKKAEGKDPEAKRYLNLLKEQQGDVLKSYCKGELARRRGEYSAAVREFDNYLQRAPDSETAEDVAYDLGEIYEKNLDQPEKALRAYAAAIVRFPSSSRVEGAVLERARILRRLKRPNEAIIEYESARHAKDPEDKLEALIAIAEMREQQGDLSGAIPYYRLALVSLPPVDLESARADEKVANRLDRQARFTAKIIELNAKLNRAESAERNTRLLLKQVWTSPEERGRILPRVVAAFDHCGLHEGGTRLVQWAGLETDTPITFAGALDDWLQMRNNIPRSTLTRCELGHLPEWAENRLKLFASLAIAQKSESAAFEAVAIGMVVAHRPAEIQDMLSRLDLEKALSDRQRMILHALGNYLLGNFHQTEGNIERAMDYYEAMYAAAGDEDFLQVLKSYRDLLPLNRPILQRWLDAERETSHGIWKGSEALLGPACSPEEARQKYEAFIRDFPACPLVGDAYYRAATLSPPVIRERYLKTVATSYPDCDSFELAFYDLYEAYSDRANWWLFAQFIESIMNDPKQKKHKAFYELRLATIYGEALRDPATARKHIQVLFDQFPGSEEWAMAKRLNSTYLMDEQKYQDAINDIKDLVRLRPDDPWVQRGRALQSMAQCHEYMGDWAQAELEYVAFLENYREAPDVAAGKVLARIVGKLSDDAKEYLYKKFPDDFVKAAVQLAPEEQSKLFDRFTGLQKRVKETQEKELAPQGNAPGD